MKPDFLTKRPYLWPVGRGGLVDPDRVVAVGRYDSAPVHTDAKRAKTEGRLIDLTFGRKVLWVLYLDSWHLVLSSEPMPVATVDGVEQYYDE